MIKESNIKRKLTDRLDDLDRKEKLKLIFKWNNGLVLEENLKLYTGDYSYKLLENEINKDLKFINSNGDCVVIDENGLIIDSPCIQPEILENISKQRLAKTKLMFDELGY